MTKIFITLFCVPIIAFFISRAEATETIEYLTFNYGPHNAPPYAMTLHGKLSDGIIRDIGLLLAKELRVNARFLPVSRKRQSDQLLSGKLDVLLITNPKWLEKPNQFIWSEPLFEEEDVLIGLTERQYAVSESNGLTNLKIGTILGYKYPTLDHLFQTGRVTRHDVRSLDANIEKLKLKRIDLLVDSSLLINYQLSQRSDETLFKILPFNLSQHHVHAAISKNASMPPEVIARALKHLVDNGSIEEILEKYR